MDGGIPSKKRLFSIARDFDGTVSCALNESILYTLYSPSEDGLPFFLRVFDLSVFDGDEERVEKLCARRTESATYRVIYFLGGYLFVYWEHPEVIRVDDMSSVYNEYSGVASSKWGSKGLVFKFGENFYRTYNARDYSSGLDVVSPSGRIIDHLDVDIIFWVPPVDEFLYGVRESVGHFCVYSLLRKMIVLELDLSKYGFADSDNLHTSTSRDGHRLYALLGDSVVVIDLNLCSVVLEFNYMECKSIEHFISVLGDRGDAYAWSLSAKEDIVVLTNAGSEGYVLCLDLSGSGRELWMKRSHYRMFAENAEGDLIYGIEERRPRAWDKYTGEEVWQASAGTIANSITLGDQWLVYSQPSGDIQCFKWTKPYTSPKRP